MTAARTIVVDGNNVELLDERPDEAFEVITSHRALADAARARDARVHGAGRFLTRLDELGC